MAPPPTRARRASGIDGHARHRGQVDHERPVADRQPGDVVAAAADRDRQALRRGRVASAATTSSSDSTRAMTAGRCEIIPFQTCLASS